MIEYPRAWKVDGRTKALVGPGLAKPLMKGGEEAWYSKLQLFQPTGAILSSTNQAVYIILCSYIK